MRRNYGFSFFNGFNSSGSLRSRAISLLTVISVITIILSACGRWKKSNEDESLGLLSGKGGQASIALSALLTGSVGNKKITDWSIEKSVSPTTITNASNSPITFTIKVIEGKTVRWFTQTQTLTITNAGSVPSYLGSLILNLQTKKGGSQFSTFTSGILDRASTPRSSVPTCFGNFTPSTGLVSMQILDAATNDLISFNQAPEILAGQTVTWVLNATFDADKVALTPGMALRNENLITFLNAGPRGNSSDSVSCSIDADGNGSTDLSRTVASRTTSYVPAITYINAQVSISDQIIQAIDASKVSIADLSMNPAMLISSTGNMGDLLSSSGSNTASSTVSASYTEGTETIFKGETSANCVLFDGSISSLINQASLSGDDATHIFASPAKAQIDITCPVPITQVVVDKVKAGDFVTYTQGGWGSKCPKSAPVGQPGCIRDSKFSTVFPSGLKVGDLSGVSGSTNGYLASWASGSAIAGVLPQGGTPCQLTADMSNPTSTSAGVLGGQLIAARMNVEFDLKSATTTTHRFCHADGSPIYLKDLIYKNSTNANDGLTVSQILSKADDIIKGPGTKDSAGKCIVPSDGSASSINEALDNINQNFDNGTTLGSNLVLPSDAKNCAP